MQWLVLLKMATNRIHRTIFLAVCLSKYIHHADAHSVDDNPFQHQETLDPQGKYQLQWTVNQIHKKVTFSVTCETRGYVGFGISSNGKMTGSDIVIGGILPSGQAYFSDRHAVANQVPQEDPKQDWILHEAHENETHTFLSFSRDFDTCDPYDYPIAEDKVTIIWSYGERDELIYHHRNRGTFDIYLLSPDHTPKIEVDPNSGRSLAMDTSTGENFQVWTISALMEVPKEETTYWCTIHKGPTLTQTHHVVGMDVRLENEVERGFVYKLLVYKCNSLEGGLQSETDMFSNFEFHPGQRCLNPREPEGAMPTEYCTELFMGWLKGGRAFFNPPHVGLPIGTSADEYYLLQVHYDNPNQVVGQVVDLQVDFFYTSQLRPNEGGMLNLRHTTPGRSPSFLIPPSSISHKIYGICGSHCTREILPKRGIHVYGVMFHAHNSGRGMRLHHFRQTKELPWIASNKNFGNNYQHHRILVEERTVLPWDVLVIGCEYDNTWTNGTVVGGFRSRDEMCAAFLFYYNRIHGYQECSSEIGSSVHRRRLLNGIRNITWSNSQMEFLVDDKNSSLRGMTITEVSDHLVDWTVERRNQLQKFQLTHEQVNWCFREVYAGGPLNPPETELIPPRPRRQKQASRGIGKKRKRRQLSPTVIPRYEPEWEDPRRYAHYPKKVKPYQPPERRCSN